MFAYQTNVIVLGLRVLYPCMDILTACCSTVRIVCGLFYLLTYGAEPFLRSRQLCSQSRTSQRFMEPEDSSPCSQQPSCPRLLVNFRNNLIFLRWGVVSPTPNPQAGGPPLIGCPRLLIQYINSYPPYLEAVSSIRNLRTRHAVVTRDPPTEHGCLFYDAI
jgi:hypothetical protein